MRKMIKAAALSVLLLSMGVTAKYNEMLDGKEVPLVHAQLTKYPNISTFEFLKPVADEAYNNGDYGWDTFIELYKSRVVSELAPIVPFSLVDEQVVFASEGFKSLQADTKFKVEDVVDVTAEGYLNLLDAKKQDKIAAIDKLGMGESIMFIDGQFSFYEDKPLLATGETRYRKMGVQAALNVAVTTKINEKKVKNTYFTMKFGKSQSTVEIDTYLAKLPVTAADFRPLFEEAVNASMTKIIDDAKKDFAK